jgi:hypothetical protein
MGRLPHLGAPPAPGYTLHTPHQCAARCTQGHDRRCWLRQGIIPHSGMTKPTSAVVALCV